MIVNGVQFGAFSGIAVLMFALVGYLPARLLTGQRGWAGIALAPGAGLALTSIIGSAIALVIGSGIRAALVLLLIAVAFGSAAMLIRDVRRDRNRRLVGTWWVGVAGICLATVGWFAVLYRGALAIYPLPAASWNNDILSYAYLSRHIGSLGLASTGWIVGYDAGQVARNDVLGALAVLIPAGYITGDEMSATLPVIAAATMAVALATLVIIHRILRVTILVAAIGGLATEVGYVATYETFQYFLAERLAEAIMLTAIGIALIGSRSFRRRVILHAGTTMALIFTYPQAVVVYLGVMFGIECARVLPRGRGRASFRPAVAVVLGGACGALLLGPYLFERIDRARMLLHVVAGWPMPTQTVPQIVGLSGFVQESATLVVLIGGVAVLLAASIGLAIFNRGRGRLSAIAAAAMLWPALLACWFAFKEPGSYRAWKAAAVAQPFLVISIMVAGAGVTALVQRRTTDSHKVANLVLVVGVTCLLIVGVLNRFDPTDSFQPCPGAVCVVGSAYRLGMRQAAEELPAGQLVAVDAPPYWDTMSAAYLLWGRPLALRNESYFSRSDAPAESVVSVRGDGSVTRK